MDNNKERYAQAISEAAKDVEETREEVIQNIVCLLRSTPFTVEFEVVDEPVGIKVVCEVTRQQMDYWLNIDRHHESDETL